MVESRYRILYRDVDRMGVLYYSRYLDLFEMGRTEFIRELGLPYAEMERRGVMLAVAEASLRYHAAARYDDLLRIETRLTRSGSRGVSFSYLIVNADTGKRLVTGHTDLVSLDASGRPAPMPPDIRALLQGATEGDA